MATTLSHSATLIGTYQLGGHQAIAEPNQCSITVGALVPLDTGPSFLGYQERGRDVTKSM